MLDAGGAGDGMTGKKKKRKQTNKQTNTHTNVKATESFIIFLLLTSLAFFRIPFQSHMLSNDASRPTFDAISQE
jgi:hypothetical protein